MHEFAGVLQKCPRTLPRIIVPPRVTSQHLWQVLMMVCIHPFIHLEKDNGEIHVPCLGTQNNRMLMPPSCLVESLVYSLMHIPLHKLLASH